MSDVTAAKVEHVLWKLVNDKYEDLVLPDHQTKALIAILKHEFPTFEFVNDASGYNSDQDLYVSKIDAKIDGVEYGIQMCYDAGSYHCVKN